MFCILEIDLRCIPQTVLMILNICVFDGGSDDEDRQADSEDEEEEDEDEEDEDDGGDITMGVIVDQVEKFCIFIQDLDIH